MRKHLPPDNVEALSTLVTEATEYSSLPRDPQQAIAEIWLTPEALIGTHSTEQERGLIYALVKHAKTHLRPWVILCLQDLEDIEQYLITPYLEIGTEEAKTNRHMRTKSGPLKICLEQGGVIILVDALNPRAEDLNCFFDRSSFKGIKIHAELRLYGLYDFAQITGVISHNVKKFAAHAISPALEGRYLQCRPLHTDTQFAIPSLPELKEKTIEIDLKFSDASDLNSLLLGRYPRNEQGQRYFQAGALTLALREQVFTGIFFKNINEEDPNVRHVLNEWILKYHLGEPLDIDNQAVTITAPLFFSPAISPTELSEQAAVKAKTLRTMPAYQCASLKKTWLVNKQNVQQLYDFNCSQSLDGGQTYYWAQQPGWLKHLPLNTHYIVSSDLSLSEWYRLLTDDRIHHLSVLEGIALPTLIQDLFKQAFAEVEERKQEEIKSDAPSPFFNILLADDIDWELAKQQDEHTVIMHLSAGQSEQHLLCGYGADHTPQEQVLWQAITAGKRIILTGLEENEPLAQQLQSLWAQPPRLHINGQIHTLHTTKASITAIMTSEAHEKSLLLSTMRLCTFKMKTTYFDIVTKTYPFITDPLYGKLKAIIERLNIEINKHDATLAITLNLQKWMQLSAIMGHFLTRLPENEAIARSMSLVFLPRLNAYPILFAECDPLIKEKFPIAEQKMESADPASSIHLSRMQLRQQNLEQALRAYPILFLQGPPASGKSFLAKYLKKEAKALIFGPHSLGPSARFDDFKKSTHTWGQKNSPRDKTLRVLFLDETNLADQHLLAWLKNLINPPLQGDEERLCILPDGTPMTLTASHRVVMTGNDTHEMGRTPTPPWALCVNCPPMTDEELQWFVIDAHFQASGISHRQNILLTTLLMNLRKKWATHEGDHLTARDFEAIIAQFIALNRNIHPLSIEISRESICGTHIIEDYRLESKELMTDDSLKQNLSKAIHIALFAKLPPYKKQAYHAWLTSQCGETQRGSSEFKVFYKFLKEKPAFIEAANVRSLAETYFHVSQTADFFARQKITLPGKGGILVLGPTGTGKDFLLDGLLEFLEKKLNEDYYRITAGTWDDFHSTIETARREGKWLIIDEITLLPSHILEGVLNQPLTGDAKPGFFIFATGNSHGSDYANRQLFSRAFNSRWIIHLHDDFPAIALPKMLENHGIDEKLRHTAMQLHLFLSQSCGKALSTRQFRKLIPILTKSGKTSITSLDVAMLYGAYLIQKKPRQRYKQQSTALLSSAHQPTEKKEEQSSLDLEIVRSGMSHLIRTPRILVATLSKNELYLPKSQYIIDPETGLPQYREGIYACDPLYSTGMSRRTASSAPMPLDMVNKIDCPEFQLLVGKIKSISTTTTLERAAFLAHLKNWVKDYFIYPDLATDHRMRMAIKAAYNSNKKATIALFNVMIECLNLKKAACVESNLIFYCLVRQLFPDLSIHMISGLYQPPGKPLTDEGHTWTIVEWSDTFYPEIFDATPNKAAVSPAAALSTEMTRPSEIKASPGLFDSPQSASSQSIYIPDDPLIIAYELAIRAAIKAHVLPLLYHQTVQIRSEGFFIKHPGKLDPERDVRGCPDPFRSIGGMKPQKQPQTLLVIWWFRYPNDQSTLSKDHTVNFFIEQYFSELLLDAGFVIQVWTKDDHIIQIDQTKPTHFVETLSRLQQPSEEALATWQKKQSKPYAILNQTKAMEIGQRLYAVLKPYETKALPTTESKVSLPTAVTEERLPETGSLLTTRQGICEHLGIDKYNFDYQLNDNTFHLSFNNIQISKEFLDKLNLLYPRLPVREDSRLRFSEMAFGQHEWDAIVTHHIQGWTLEFETCQFQFSIKHSAAINLNIVFDRNQGSLPEGLDAINGWIAIDYNSMDAESIVSQKVVSELLLHRGKLSIKQQHLPTSVKIAESSLLNVLDLCATHFTNKIFSLSIASASVKKIGGYVQYLQMPVGSQAKELIFPGNALYMDHLVLTTHLPIVPEFQEKIQTEYGHLTPDAPYKTHLLNPYTLKTFLTCLESQLAPANITLSA